MTPERYGRLSAVAPDYQPPSNTFSLRQVIKAGNKFTGDYASLWEFRILNNVGAVGYMRDSMVRAINWTNTAFVLYSSERLIHLNPVGFSSQDPKGHCERQFIVLLEMNRHRIASFIKWTPRPSSFFPIACQQINLRGTRMPAPMRVIFGIVTYGVHLNAYTTCVVGGQTQMHVWVAERSQTTTFPGMMDQIVAGGVDHLMPLEPILELEREAKEEAGWDLNKATMTMLYNGKVIGTVIGPRRLTFYDQKDRRSGNEDGHLEPGVRFVFDVELDASFIPVPQCAQETRTFMLKSVDQVKTDLLTRRWKPNSGLAMLQSLIWKGHITAQEADVNLLLQGLHPALPLPTIA